MRVTFLQHDDCFPPGELREYFTRRHRALSTVLIASEIDERDDAVLSADLIVSLGSPVSVYSTDVAWVTEERRILSRAISKNVPVLGICFGAQMIASCTGGSMTAIGKSYVGWFDNDTITSPVWQGPWFRFHKDQCNLSPRAQVFARSQGTVQAFQCGSAVGLQFHPEMNLEIVDGLSPAMRDYFGMTSAHISLLLQETRTNVDAIGRSRDALFGEVLRLLGLDGHTP